MALYLGIIATFLIQEFASVAAALVAAHNNHLNLWIVHAIWLAGTIVDILVGYYVGQWLRETSDIAWVKRYEKKLNDWRERLGDRGVDTALTLLAIIDYPWINAFAASWIDIPFRSVFLFTLLGNAIWYGLELATVFGLIAVAPDFTYWIIGGAAIAFVLLALFGYWKGKSKMPSREVP